MMVRLYEKRASGGWPNQALELAFGLGRIAVNVVPGPGSQSESEVASYCMKKAEAVKLRPCATKETVMVRS
jgi:hypothetical protein